MNPIIVVLCACLCAGVSARAEVLDVLPRFTVGERLHLEITRSREDSAYKLSNGTNITKVLVTVKSKDENNLVLEWTPGETQLEPAHAKVPLIAVGARLMNGFPLTFRFTARGELRELMHVDQINTRFQKVVPEVIASVAAEITNAAERKTFQETAPKSVNLNAALQPVFGDVTLWAAFNGFSFDTGKPIKSRAVGQHPIDVGKISSDLEMAIKVSAEQKQMVLTGRQAYDPNGFAGMLRSLLLQSQISFRPQGGKIPEINMSDEFEYVFDTDRALAKRASRKRNIVVDPLLKRADTLTVAVKSVE